MATAAATGLVETQCPAQMMDRVTLYIVLLLLLMDVAVGMSLLVYNQHLKICLYLLPSVWMLGYELDSRQLSSATNKRLMLGRCVGALSLRWSLVMLAKQVALFDYCLINLDVSAQPQPFLLVSGRSHPLI